MPLVSRKIEPGSLPKKDWGRKISSPFGRPNGDEIFRPQSFFGNDPGSIFLETSGTYTLQVGGNLNSGTGAYSLRIQPVPPDDEFNIQIGQTIEANADQVGMPT